MGTQTSTKEKGKNMNRIKELQETIAKMQAELEALQGIDPHEEER